ncbi:hypothetical protein [Brevibacillus centrosporus]|uniref:Uncharacterized protein n=1 Tax=Brevibacillus centrosporus TaxID=54910 RepID=A0A1I3LKF7_9BACL|nr:hypothetical protein [Brevibacillus centrosporus]MEC2131392.1 hypothetical protein [Brevibacillus centrosporus]MED4906917.1 hypothetical protein [Brevibacillus centrosporus]RNB72583.1 hypothetical protein EDM55_05095 [Brevibacillus centrosporus]SFI84955.1 hypothetical protein SAMN05518846_101342 [Brevibacillus centrosporus]GED31604.1 hypothetical protein BCE02nite_27450 [Brevibacillus centrosporus]
MANKGKLLMIFTLFFLLMGIRLAWGFWYQPAVMPFAKQGVLDASSWDFTGNGSIQRVSS